MRMYTWMKRFFADLIDSPVWICFSSWLIWAVDVVVVVCLHVSHILSSPAPGEMATGFPKLLHAADKQSKLRISTLTSFVPEENKAQQGQRCVLKWFNEKNYLTCTAFS